MWFHQTRVLSFTGLFALATAAWTLNASDLLLRADTLRAVHDELQLRIEQCPDGSCSDAQRVVNDSFDASARLAQLESDRGELGSCDCATLDLALRDLQTVNTVQRIHLEGWGQ